MTNKVAFINDNDNDYHLDLQSNYVIIFKMIFIKSYLVKFYVERLYLFPLIAK